MEFSIVQALGGLLSFLGFMGFGAAFGFGAGWAFIRTVKRHFTINCSK